MKVFIKRNDGGVAEGEYDIETKQLVVLKGSMITEEIRYSAKFRGAKVIEKRRQGTVKNGKVMKDISFSSASTAANFVTGYSTNGLLAWRDENGRRLKDVISTAKE